MKKRLTAFMLSASLLFSSLFMPFFCINTYATQAVFGWDDALVFVAETIAAYFVDKGLDQATSDIGNYTVKGGKLSSADKAYVEKLWNQFATSNNFTDEQLQNFKNQIMNGNLDMSGEVGTAFMTFLRNQGANVAGDWNSFNDMQSVSYPVHWSEEDVNNFLRSYASAHGEYKPTHILGGYCVGCYGLFLVKYVHSERFEEDTFKFGTLTYDTTSHNYGFGGTREISVWSGGTYILSNGDTNYTFKDMEKDSKIYCSPTIADVISKDTDNQIDTAYLTHSQTHHPSIISAYGGNIPDIHRNTFGDDGSNDNDSTYTTLPATVDWSKIFDNDGNFKPHSDLTVIPKIKDDGSNYDDIIKLIKSNNMKMDKILKWLRDYDGGTKGKIKDSDLSPIIDPSSPLFNFKLNEKFPFSLPWDMLAILSILKADPIPPKIDIPILLPDSNGKVKDIKLSDDKLSTTSGDKITIDFSGDTWQKAAKILRLLELLLFIIGMAVLFWKYGK